MLCLLAALFAVEAKMAWYSPAGSASAQISASKLQPADVSKVISRSISAQAPPGPDFIVNAAVVAVAILSMATISLVARTVPSRLQISASPAFSSCLFFRPPPTI
jgi:hypothetical protein